MNTLIIGVGNELLGDEGLGVHVARRLAAHPSLPDSVQVIEAGTSLFDFIPDLPACSRVILVDAIRAGRTPGTIWQAESSTDLACESASDRPLSLHDWGVAETLDAADQLGLAPARLTIIGAEPENLSPGIGLSPTLSHAADTIVTTILKELRS